MKASIVIPAYNNADVTEKCLVALFKNTKMDLVEEVIVVNNASTDHTKDVLAKFKEIKVITNRVNNNFAGACNVGAKAAVGEVIIFLNNDTEVHPGWIEGIVDVFKRYKKVGAVGIKLLFPNGTVQHAGLAFYDDHIPRHIYYQSKADQPYVNKEREFKAVTAACVAIPKKLLIEMGGFDEAYKNGMEDVDLCLKIYHAGYKIIYTPNSVVTHYESISPGRFLKSKPNADLYMSRWKDEEPDAKRYFKEDGFSALKILYFELAAMTYGKDEYKTRPLKIKILRIPFIPIQKIYTVVKLLAKGDFKEIKDKLRRYI